MQQRLLRESMRLMEGVHCRADELSLEDVVQPISYCTRDMLRATRGSDRWPTLAQYIHHMSDSVRQTVDVVEAESALECKGYATPPRRGAEDGVPNSLAASRRCATKAAPHHPHD